MAARYLVPALAVAGRAAAASCSVAATTTIQNQGDASALAACSTFSGSIALATDTVGAIQLDGIKEITGSLVLNNVSDVSSISGDSLTTIDDTFELASLNSLTSVQFPVLTSVKTIDWSALNLLTGLNLAAQIKAASSVSITDTSLQSLTGLSLAEVDTFMLVSNRFLNEITLPFGNISTSLTISSNGQTAAASFPNLVWANDMTLSTLQSLSFPLLAAMNGTLGLQMNTFTSVAAPNLTSIGGDLNIVGNTQLTNVSMPELTTITQAFLVANNSDLAVVNQFGSLTTIQGTLDFYGIFTDVELPAIKNIAGAFNLHSTDTTGSIDKSCATFKGESGSSSAIKVFNDNACNGDDSTALTDGNSTTTPGASGTTSGSAASTGAANNLVITGATGLLGVVAAIFGML